MKIKLLSALSCLAILINLNLYAQNNCLHFDGQDDYVNAGDIDALDGASELTIEMWVNIETWSMWKTFFSKFYTPNDIDYDRIQFQEWSSTGDLGVIVATQGGGNSYGYTTTQPVYTGEWFHIAMVYDGNGTENSDKLKLYINGNLVPLSYSGTIPSVTPSTSQPILLGGESERPGNLNAFTGQMDEVRIWLTARTQSQIRQKMNTQLTGNEAGLLLYYDFNQGEGGDPNPGATILNDATPNGYNGTLINFELDGSTSNWIARLYSTPAVQAHNITAVSYSTELDVTWTNGSGSQRAVFIIEGSAGSPTPEDGVKYKANAVYGLGEEIPETGWYCVYNGNQNSVKISGLNEETTYRVMVCEYNGISNYEAYNTSPGANNPEDLTTSAGVTTDFSAVLQAEKQFYRPDLPAPFDDQYTSDQWTDNTSTLYNYSTQLIEVTAAGAYEIKIESVVGFDDPMLFVYGENFDPDSPLLNGIIANDDCNTLNSQITYYLPVGVYTLVVTSYSEGDVGTVNYKVTGAASVIVGMNTTPLVQASEIQFSNVNDTNMKISFIKGDGIKRAAFMKEEAGTIENPTDRSTYTASPDWNSKGSQLGSSGYYCIFNGSADTFTVYNLTPQTDYIVQIFEYNGSEGFEKFLTVTAANNPSNQTALPVELASFSSVVINNKVELSWQTSTEVNNYGFEVERCLKPQSKDKKAEWEKVGFVMGNGNSNSKKSYSFKDFSPLAGKLEYRLKQIDSDGEFRYSNVIEANVEAPVYFSIGQNYPNPFNPSTSIVFELPVNCFVLLKVYDQLGREIKTLAEGEKPAGSYIESWDGTNSNGAAVSSGIYFYKISAGSYTETRKMNLLK